MRKTIINEFSGWIYIIKNTVNEKVYVGETMTKINKRLSQHLTQAFYEKSSCYNCRLHKAIRELGKSVFYIEQLAVIHCTTKSELKKELKKLEKKYIKQYDSFNKGYNSNSGSNGGSILGEDVKKHLSLIGKKNTKNIERLVKSNKERSKSVDIYDFYTGEYLKTFASVKEVSIEYNVDNSLLVKVCKGKAKYATLNNKRCKLVYSGNTYEREFQFKVTDEIGSFVDYCIDSYDIKNRYGVDYSAVYRVCNGTAYFAGKKNGQKLIWSYYEKDNQ